IVCYMDSTVALPILTYYALKKHKKRPLKKLYYRREELLQKLIREYFAHNPQRRKDIANRILEESLAR
ncbi:MAG: deoxyhypusine synthase, partial [Candidatus Omnitrophica bacterium]|nr:deoxyhypusine synthase [Candidatus Omnitrophota bacterium]